MFRIVCDPSSGSVERAWIANDSKHVVVLFNCLLKLIQRGFLTSEFYIIECISRPIKVIVRV